MSEASSIAKIVLALGMVFLIVGLLYPGNDSGWTNFTSSTQNFPAFNDPFANEALSIGMVPSSNGVLGASVIPHGCTLVEYWKCVRTDDGTESYLDLVGPGNPLLTLHFVTPNLNTSISAIKVHIVAHSIGTVQPYLYLVILEGAGPVHSFSNMKFQVTSDTYTDLVYESSYDLSVGEAWPWWLITNFDLGIGLSSLFPYGDGISITYVHIEVLTSGTNTCPTLGPWWSIGDNLQVVACVLRQGIDVAIKIFEFIVNGVIFLAQIVIYTVNVIISFIGMLTFLFSLPNAPSLIQGVITAFVVGCIMLVIIAILRIARGSGSTG